MVIVNLEKLLDEVSPQIAPFSFAQVCTLRTPFAVPVQQRDWSVVQSRDGARRHRES
jgi:hypothetical protein